MNTEPTPPPCSFQTGLRGRLASLKADGLYRQLRRLETAQGSRIQVDGQACLNFSSNDYLGLANDPLLTAAASQAMKEYGFGAGASRLICGSSAWHERLEQRLALFKGTESALTFSTGYAAAMGTIPALVGAADCVILDKLAHACLVDAARLSRAQLRVFPHNDLDKLNRLLAWAAGRRAAGKILVVTESVFSMDGDQAPLKEIVELKDRYGAWLMVDEAHATGLFGHRRQGLCAHLGIADRVEIQMGTLSKALGASGGFICGSRLLTELLINQARSFIFSTAPPPPAAAAAAAAVDFIASAEGAERCHRLWERIGQFLQGLRSLPAGERIRRGGPAGGMATFGESAIIPLILGEEQRALHMAGELRQHGFFIPAIRYPAVPRGQARLRVTLSANHTAEEVDRLLKCLGELDSSIAANP